MWLLNGGTEGGEDNQNANQNVGELSELHGAVLYEIFHFLSFKHLLTSICLVCHEWKIIVNECCQHVILSHTPQISSRRVNGIGYSVANPKPEVTPHKMPFDGDTIVAIANQFRLRSLCLGNLERSYRLKHFIDTCYQNKEKPDFLHTIVLLRCSLEREVVMVKKLESTKVDVGPYINMSTGELVDNRRGGIGGLFSSIRSFFTSRSSKPNESTTSVVVENQQKEKIVLDWEIPTFGTLAPIFIQKLEMVECQIEHSDFQTLLDLMPNLKDLTIRECIHVKKLSIHKNHQLESLSVDHRKYGIMEMSISDEVAANLTSVSLIKTRGVTTDHYLNLFDRNTSPKLQKLTIDLFFSNDQLEGRTCACTDLTLAHSSGTSENRAWIFQCLNKWFPDVEVLCITNVSIPGNLEKLSFPKLRSFQTDSPNMMLSIDSMTNLVDLTLLDMKNNYALSFDRTVIRDLIECCPNSLSSLRIERTPLESSDASSICRKFYQLSSLTVSMCGDIYFEPESFHHLKTLNLSYNSQISDTHLMGISRLNPQLESLNLKMCKKIEKCPLELSNLKQLLLSGTSIDDGVLNDILGSCPNLQRLDINCCSNLVNPILQSNSLMYLDVSENAFLKTNSVAIMIAKLPVLRVLIARWCPQMFLADSLDNFYPALKHLSLLDVVGSLTTPTQIDPLIKQLKENDKDIEVITVEKIAVANSRLVKQFKFHQT